MKERGVSTREISDLPAGTIRPEMREQLERAAAILKSYGAQEVYVFGSAASGEMREESDIDLAVSGLPPEDYFPAMGAAGEVLDRPFDLLDLDVGGPIVDHLRKWEKLVRVA